MVLAKQRAEVGWKGTLEEGQGSFTAGKWMLGEVPVTWAARTNSEELIAAHASCYAMALSLVLAEEGTPPENIDVEATCVLDDVSEGFRITTMDLDAGEFQDAAEQAHHICPVSNALKGNVEVGVNSVLED
ncbi:MAG TPA: OsmC family peroxiredoxin [Rubrobacter sp.]|nr:OsmC family peroxiredoxin [Rubrobacter sp.]